jgi:hypothetical protein
MITHTTRAPVPLEALNLQDDITLLRICRDLLGRIEPESLTEEREVGRKILQLLRRELQLCQSFAEQRMRVEYLAPRRKKFERKGRSGH